MGFTPGTHRVQPGEVLSTKERKRQHLLLSTRAFPTETGGCLSTGASNTEKRAIATVQQPAQVWPLSAATSYTFDEKVFSPFVTEFIRFLVFNITVVIGF